MFQANVLRKQWHETIQNLSTKVMSTTLENKPAVISNRTESSFFIDPDEVYSVDEFFEARRIF